MLRGTITTMILLAGILSLNACSASTAGHPLYEWVRESCREKEPCRVRMQDYTDFEWDKMYVFAPQLMEYEIKEVLGASVHRSGEYANAIVFIKGDRIVHYFENPSNVNSREKGSVVFTDIPLNKKHKVYDRDVVFDVKKQYFTHPEDFLLSCAQCAGSSESGD